MLKNSSKAIPDDLRAHIRAEYTKVWGSDERMISHCCGKISRAAWLDDGTAFIWEKPSIEKHFCFGESGYDYDEAQNMAAHARNSEDYFRSENLREFDAVIAALEGEGTGFYDNAQPYIRQIGYHGPRAIGLSDLQWLRPADFYRLSEQQKQNIRLPFQSELETITEGYKAERTAFEKRLNSYLKRYGLSQVKSWTYWRDA